MIEDVFDFFNGNDLPLSIVLACIIIFAVFLYGATISTDKHRKDVRQKNRDDESDTK